VSDTSEPSRLAHGFLGLNDEEVVASRLVNGSNRITAPREGAIAFLRRLAGDPMLLLLLTATTVYFLTSQTGEAIFMLAAIVLTTSISLYQSHRSSKALAALKELTNPKCKVIRGGALHDLPSDEVVVGDTILIEEGTGIPADATVIRSNDLSVNESVLTGESIAVAKRISPGDDKVYRGTHVASGAAFCTVTSVGSSTRLGKIGLSLVAIKVEQSPLQVQIGSFVRRMALLGIVVFLVVWGFNFWISWNILDSLLKALALAMSILPEEIPVALTTFMALGVWRLSKFGVIAKATTTIETLGSATVICLDKTGTITTNEMKLQSVYHFKTNRTFEHDLSSQSACEVVEPAMWASEPAPFDPMEIALHDEYSKDNDYDRRKDFRMIHEYPLEGIPPMMTHVFEHGAERIIAAKGAPEAIIDVCRLSPEEAITVRSTVNTLSTAGSRVLGVAVSDHKSNEFPAQQQQLPFTFIGLVAFYDPPKANIPAVLNSFYDAGLEVKIITGDYATTTRSICKQIGFRGESNMDGADVLRLSESELRLAIGKVNIFTRMFPEAKLKVINALKDAGHVVAMTGDGVNDGPALKAAHIGVAMGKRGTEMAKRVSSLVLTDDNLERMVPAIELGRKIYVNLKKAIQYIVSIHIPIILIVLLPLLFGWVYPTIFTPVHVIFLELIMGPTCSIIYENEPPEPHLMKQPPRMFSRALFHSGELITAIAQGLAITGGLVFIYHYAAERLDEQGTRAMVFVTLISANILLTLVNRSSLNSILESIRYKNNLIPFIVLVTLLLTALILGIEAVAHFFSLERPTGSYLVISILTGFASVIWIEGIKWWKRKKPTHR
jgi:Ca2+-transporting ATPase